MTHTLQGARVAPSGETIVTVRWAGADVAVRAVLDEQELRRRYAYGLGAVVSYEIHQALATLPVGFPIAESDVDPADLRVLHGAPAGVVECRAGTVTSWLSPPLAMIEIRKSGASWRGMSRLAPFVGIAPTTLVVAHAPRHRLAAEAAAQRSGIGLAVRCGGEPDWLVTPSVHARPSVGRTRFAEVVLARLLRQTAGTPATSSHAFSCFEGA